MLTLLLHMAMEDGTIPVITTATTAIPIATIPTVRFTTTTPAGNAAYLSF
ncbi:MAG: hypothetical protein Kow00121_08800 [Elainellaceae cyanobacterium]